MTLFHLGVFATSLLCSFVLTRFVRNLALAQGWVAAPASDRHVHTEPLPRLGGVAIFLSFLISIGFLLLVIGWHSPAYFSWGRLGTILLAGTLVFLVGVYDDLRQVGPYVKFGVQAVAGSILFASGLRILDLPLLFGGRHFPWIVGYGLTILWVLAVTNAFNLIDGLDGLAAASALFSTLVVFVVAVVSHSFLVSFLTLALAGTILGFLRYNFNPATIFLGDSGSLFIGFMLSALALQGAQKAPTIIAVAIPVVSFGLPILETTISVLRRFLSGRPVFSADREHIHHKLLQRGLSQRQAVIVLYAVSALFALLSLFLLWPTGSTLGLVLAVLGVGVWMGIQHLNYLEFGELRRVAQRTMEQRQIFINNLSIRRATEELKAAKSPTQIGRILIAAFSTNDFDAFELQLDPSFSSFLEMDGLQKVHSHSPGMRFQWRKPGCHFAHVNFWNLSLELVTAHNQRCGSMTLYRIYADRGLHLDISLLVSIFPAALANALDWVHTQKKDATAESRPKTPLATLHAD